MNENVSDNKLSFEFSNNMEELRQSILAKKITRAKVLTNDIFEKC